VSSIYDALRRIQGEKGAWAAPPERSDPPAGKGVKAGLIAAFVVVLVVVYAAVIYYGIYIAGDKKAVQETAVPKAHHAPGASQAANRQHPQGPTPAMPPQAGPAGLPPQAMPPGAAMNQTPVPPAALPGQPPVPPAADTLEGYLKAGDRYFVNHDYDNALVTYNKALHYFGKDVRVLNNIGSVFLAQGQPRQAIHYFQESNSISKEYVEPIYNLACAYARLGDSAKAVMNLRKAVRLNPEAKKWATSDPDLMTLKGRGDFDRTIGAQ
jgi:cytochrome c-type biogenesis protein CcmH/NrfG